MDAADNGKTKGWETKTMIKLFRLKRQKDETWVEYHTRTCNLARKIWVKMKLPFLYEKVAESMWRAMGWACDKKVNTVTYSLKKVFKWKSTRWWHSLHTDMMKEDSENHTRWKHKLGWHNRGNVWHKMASSWAGKEDWTEQNEAVHRTQKTKR